MFFKAGPINGKLRPKPTNAPTGFLIRFTNVFGAFLTAFLAPFNINSLNLPTFAAIKLNNAENGFNINALNVIRRIVPASTPTKLIIFPKPTVNPTASPVINARLPKNLILKSLKASVLPSDFNLKNVIV